MQDYKHVQRWADAIAERPAVKRGRMVNRAVRRSAGQLRERHDASDFETRTQDKLAAAASGRNTVRRRTQYRRVFVALLALTVGAPAFAQSGDAALRQSLQKIWTTTWRREEHRSTSRRGP